MGDVVRPFRERAVTFGSGRSLVGVLTAPAELPDVDQPVIVILNAGVIHRVGANRLHVRLAREFAPRGHLVMRFDLSGIGDSDPRGDEADLDRAVQRDVTDALNYLESEHGARSFIIFGLCSGANNGFRCAVADPRVTGAILIDPTAYPTFRFYLTHFVPRLLRGQTWIRLFTGEDVRVRRFRDWITGRAVPQQLPPVPVGVPAPTKSEMDQGLGALVGRNVELLLVFTGGLVWQYNYATQFRDTFPRHARSEHVRVAYLPKSDHTFSAESSKTDLIEIVLAWLATNALRARARLGVERLARVSASLTVWWPLMAAG